jgi:hypothetical protein
VPEYVAFLRGDTPMNATMSELKHGFELPAGATRIVTCLREPHPALALPLETDPRLNSVS